MSITTHLPTTRTGRGATLAGVAGLWVLAYWVNGWLWDVVFYDLLGMPADDRLTETLHFFFYDTVKIALLLSGIIFVITILRSYMSIERTRALLGGRHEGVGNVMAAGLGVVTPFCSCSAVPGVHRVRRGRGAAGCDAELPDREPPGQRDRDRPAADPVRLAGHRWPTSSPVVSIAIVAGWVLGRLRLERFVEPFVFETKLGGQVIDSTAGLTFAQRVQMGAEEVGTILRKIWPYLLVGIGLGAVIHGWAPEDFFTRYAGPGSTFGVLVAVLIGIPLYSNAAGILPLVEALHDKGLPMGTLLAFMMAVVALSLPEMILLRRVLKPQLLGIYVAVVGASIVAVGYLFNYLLA